MIGEDIYLNVAFYDVENKLAIERLLCEKVSQTICCIQEIPLYAYNLALGDVVVFQNKGNELFFDKIVSTSGNSTIQIVELSIGGLTSVLGNIKNHIDGLHLDISEKYAAINIATFEQYIEIRDILSKAEQNNLISFKEACLGFEK